MGLNAGKKFEEDIKKSVPTNPEECWIYRFRDSSGAWQGGENTRFTPSNICDFQVMYKSTLFLLELKSHQGVSIPFSCIRKNQIEDMAAIKQTHMKAFFLLNFRDIERTYAVEAKQLKAFMESADRKSVPIRWCIDNGIEIPSEKKRTRFRYDIEVLFRGEN